MRIFMALSSNSFLFFPAAYCDATVLCKTKEGRRAESGAENLIKLFHLFVQKICVGIYLDAVQCEQGLADANQDYSRSRCFNSRACEMMKSQLDSISRCVGRRADGL